MKQNILFRTAVAMLLASAAFTACTDTIAVGDASLDKATSSTATIDSVFQNAEYTRQFLVGIYSKQYYGLPYYNGGTSSHLGIVSKHLRVIAEHPSRNTPLLFGPFDRQFFISGFGSFADNFQTVHHVFAKGCEIASAVLLLQY